MGTISNEGKRKEENFETITECSGQKTEGAAKINEIKGPKDKLNKTLRELMTMMERNCESIEQMNDDISNLKKNVAYGQEKLGQEMKSLKLELKNCLKSNHEIEKDNSKSKKNYLRLMEWISLITKNLVN